jgi:phosphomannomutase / phosphoglucomutase
MLRIFSLLSIATAFMIILASAGVYWMASSVISNAKLTSADVVAKSVALTISEQIEMLNATFDKVATDPELIAAVISANPAQLNAIAEKIAKHIPNVLKLRILLPGVSELDDKSTPKMGFADLDMVKETFTEDQFPGIQGDAGSDRHLAITHKIIKNNQVIGVILASMNFEFIEHTVQAAKLNNGYIELKQGPLIIGSSGNKSESQNSEKLAVDVQNTNWNLIHWYPAGANFGEFTLIFSFIIIPALLVTLAFFVGYRRLSNIISTDLSTVMKAFKDMMTTQLQGNYPVIMPEMHAVISTLVQFKRVMDNQENETLLKDEDDLHLDGFFDESVDFSISEPLIIDSSFDEFVQKEVAKEPPSTVTESLPVQLEPVKEIKKNDGLSVIFRAYDIRGIVGTTLNAEVVYNIGRAIGTDAVNQNVKTIVVGRDGRTSSPGLAEALVKGISTTGCHVLDIGMVPTPVLYFIAQHTEGRSGVMITGSHNPANYNGLKMVINGETLADGRIQQLRHCIDQQSYLTGPAGSIEQNQNAGHEYIGTIADSIRVNKPMVIVLDCGNGVTGELGPALFKALGCEVIELFCDIDGKFPNHHPDPSKPENLFELIETVKHYKADLGIAFDGDGDRLGVIDSSGKIIWPDRQMMLFAKDVLAGKPGSEIIYDVKCTRHLADQITKFGGRPVMWKTGHSYMKAKLKETGAKLAGEMSGHIFFNDRWFGFDDALYSAARLIEILSKEERSTADIFSQFPDSVNTPELTIELAEGENVKFIENLFAEANFTAGKINNIDGMRVDFVNGWGLVRSSNTTPSLVIRFEADTKEALLSIQEQFRELMKKVKPDIILPF